MTQQTAVTCRPAPGPLSSASEDGRPGPHRAC